MPASAGDKTIKEIFLFALTVTSALFAVLAIWLVAVAIFYAPVVSTSEVFERIPDSERIILQTCISTALSISAVLYSPCQHSPSALAMMLLISSAQVVLWMSSMSFHVRYVAAGVFFVSTAVSTTRCWIRRANWVRFMCVICACFGLVSVILIDVDSTPMIDHRPPCVAGEWLIVIAAIVHVPVRWKQHHPKARSHEFVHCDRWQISDVLKNVILCLFCVQFFRDIVRNSTILPICCSKRRDKVGPFDSVTHFFYDMLPGALGRSRTHRDPSGQAAP